MLRITRIVASVSYVTLLVEGQIRQPWAAELEREVLACRSAGKKVVLDFSGVTLVSTEGAEMVRRLQEAGAQLTNLSRIVQDLLK